MGYIRADQVDFNYDITVALKPYQTVGSLFSKPKDPVPNDQTYGSIYSIPSQDLWQGETKSKFASWLKEHQKAVKHKNGKSLC